MKAFCPLAIIQAYLGTLSLQRDFGAQADGESDELKRVLLEGNPYFLAITFCVSILHSVFDMLAFKNDIGFWKGKKNVEGLSVRTVGINCVCQVTVFDLWGFPTSQSIKLKHSTCSVMAAGGTAACLHSIVAIDSTCI